MDKRIKILIISPYPIFPLHYGGKIRIFQIARNLSKLNFNITVIAPFKIGDRSTVSINKNFRIHSVKYPPFLIPFLLVDRPFPYQFLVSFHPGYRFLMKKYLEGFDIYQFEHASFADLLDYLPAEKIVVYNSQNVEHDYVKSECHTGFAESLSLKRIYSFENKLIQRSAKIFACSEEDRKRFIELYNTSEDKISIIPNGVSDEIDVHLRKEDAIKKFPALSGFKKRVLFSGSDVKHNRVAVKFILNELAPRLERDCAFIVKGTCGKKFKRHKLGNVFIDPEGGKILPYAKISTSAINPVIQGGGTSLKVLEYLKYKLPVISTPFGIRGHSDLKEFITLCDLNTFADAIRKEQRLPSRAGEMLKRYTWRNSALRIKDIYLSLLGRK